MIISMTGFGAARLENDNLVVISEVKSLNSKYLDINLKLPKGFSPEKELELRNLIKDHLRRGKIVVSLDFQHKQSTQPSVNINEEIFHAHFNRIRDIAIALDASQQDILRLAMQMPDVVNQDINREDTQDDDWPTIVKVFLESLTKCRGFRESEGKKLQEELSSYIIKIDTLLKEVDAQDPKRVAFIKERVLSRVSEIQKNEMFDKNRFEQEMIYYIEKLDITEEKVRLQKHLEYFLQTLENVDSNGKKLNFISQEIGREVNTIGSKANDAEIQRLVVDMKEELEKVKEQLLNVL